MTQGDLELLLTQKEQMTWGMLVDYLKNKGPKYNFEQILSPIIQGGTSKELRKISAEKLIDLDSIESVKNQQIFAVSMSEKMNANCLSIKDFLFDKVYNHKTLMVK